MNRSFIMIKNLQHKDLNVIQCGTEKCEPDHSFGPTTRDYYLLHYVVNGKGMFTTRGVSYNLSAGDIFVIKPGDISYYRADSEKPWEYIWIGFTAEIPLPHQLQRDTFRIFYAQSIFKSMLSCDEFSYGREAFLCGCLWQLFARMLEQDQKQDSRDAVQMAVSCIETEFDTPLSVIELAERLHLNRSYFSTIFKQAMGVSPHQYLINTRLNKAAELMTTHRLNPGRAALACGYSDIYSFSRMFKRHYGISPGEYIKLNRS